MKTPQIIINAFLAMLGLTMIVHFWGDLTASAIVSEIVGFVLIAIGLISVTLYFRKRGARNKKN